MVYKAPSTGSVWGRSNTHLQVLDGALLQAKWLPRHACTWLQPSLSRLVLC